MEYKKIGALTNEIFAELIGESDLVTEDLSNIATVGERITSDTRFDDNYEQYTRKIVDKVGKTIFHDDTLADSHLPIYRDSWTYGAILEKIRVEAPEATEDMTYDLSNYTGDDVFTFAPAEASEKFFEGRTTFKIKVSIPSKQLRSAFKSASAMSRFISGIENRIKLQMDIRSKSLEYRTVANFIAEKFKGGNTASLVNLFAEYVEETGDSTVTVKNCLRNIDFLRYANMRIGKLRTFLRKPSMLYGDGGYTNITNASEEVVMYLSDLESAINTYLLAVNRHNEYLSGNLGKYTAVPYWQAGGTNDSYENRSSINVIPDSEGDAPRQGADTRRIIKLDNILGIIFDYRAMAVTNEESETTSMNVPDARFTNFWHFREAGYINDTDENAIVLYLSEYKSLGRLAEEPEDFGSGYYTYSAAGEYEAVGSADFDENTIYFKKVTA